MARGVARAVKGFISDVFGDVKDELTKHYKEAVLDINVKTNKKLTEKEAANRELVRKANNENPLTRSRIREVAPALLGTGAVGGAAATKVYESLPDNPTSAQLTSALRKHLKENKVPASVTRTVLNKAKEKSEDVFSQREEKKQDVNRRRALESVRKAEEERNAPPMPRKRPDGMYKGGYKTKKANKGMMNTKKSRTGAMDYRKGGLFTK